jgi:hypothetical protein
MTENPYGLVPTGERQPCIVMTRVNGWYVDKKASNPGKQAEYADRLTYDKKDNWPQ